MSSLSAPPPGPPSPLHPTQSTQSSPLFPLLNRTLHIHTIDGRLFIGPLLSIDRSSSLLISPVLEYAAPLPTHSSNSSLSTPSPVLNSTCSSISSDARITASIDTNPPKGGIEIVVGVEAEIKRAEVIDRYYPHSERYDGSGPVYPFNGRPGRELGMVLIPGSQIIKVEIENVDGLAIGEENAERNRKEELGLAQGQD